MVDWAQVVIWSVLAAGFGLWMRGWSNLLDAIVCQRFQDCGTLMVISATLALYFVRDRELNFLDWFIFLLGPLLIVTALWRLFRTQSHIKS